MEITPAVVMDVRNNGLLVFIPKYGLRGPLFMLDTHGHALMPPSAFQFGIGCSGLAGGTKPARSVSRRARELASTGTQAVLDALQEDGALKVVHPGTAVHVDREKGVIRMGVPQQVAASTPASLTPITIRTLDVVLVQVTCDFTADAVRRPPLRYRFVASTPLALAIARLGSIHPGGTARQMQRSGRRGEATSAQQLDVDVDASAGAGAGSGGTGAGAGAGAGGGNAVDGDGVGSDGVAVAIVEAGTSVPGGTLYDIVQHASHQPPTIDFQAFIGMADAAAPSLAGVRHAKKQQRKKGAKPDKVSRSRCVCGCGRRGGICFCLSCAFIDKVACLFVPPTLAPIVARALLSVLWLCRLRFGGIGPFDPEGRNTAKLSLSAASSASPPGDGSVGMSANASASVLKSDRSIQAATRAAQVRMQKRLTAMRHAKINSRRRAQR